VADIEPPRVSFNPIVTGYELITLSFGLDWVVNVGQWLSAMSFLIFSTNYVAAGGVYASCRRTLDLQSTVWKTIYSGTNTFHGESTASISIRTPQNVSLRPHVNLRLNLAKVFDLTALLAQIVKSIR
jgi:hypothetical protein